ncbi:hypothetical protein ACWA16_18635, partial [Bacillus subtilis]
ELGFLFYICADLLSLVSILLIFLNPNTITSMINLRVINNQNAGCTGDSSRLHPTAIGRIEPPIHWQRAACLSFVWKPARVAK